MKQNLKNVSGRKSNRSLFLWSLGGFIIAASIRCADILPDFFRRLHWALTGGVGESAVWDEPLFYMAIVGIPAGLVGAIIAFAIVFADAPNQSRVRKMESNRHIIVSRIK